MYLKISIPPDGTLKAFCLNFFQAVDKLLHTGYLKQAFAAETVAKMTILMGKVATSISLGLLIVDEFQNLKIAKTEQCVVVFNMFVQIIEDYGISIVTMCTPGIQKLLSAKIAITRKLMGNTTYFPLMAAGSDEWKHFTEAVWPFSYTTNTSDLTPAVRAAWHKTSGGNAAFAVHAYKLAQEYAITNDLIVDDIIFEMVLNTSFAALKPAIDALVRGRATELDAFEDLICDPQSRALIAALMPHAIYTESTIGVIDSTGPEAVGAPPSEKNTEDIDAVEEFEEVQETKKPAKLKKSVAAASAGIETQISKRRAALQTRPVGKDLA